MSIHYKRHLIDARAYPLRGIGGWTSESYVFDMREMTDTLFWPSPNVFPTREAAIEAAIQVGRQKIDVGFEQGRLL